MGNCQIPKIDGQDHQTFEMSEVNTKLQEILEQKPYLERKVHPMHYWVQRCYSCIDKGNLGEAQDSLMRIQAAIKIDHKRMLDAFQKFDMNQSGDLEAAEFRHFVTYVGFGPDCVDGVLKQSDKNDDGVIQLEEFEAFVGHMGGIQTLFSQRRVHKGRNLSDKKWEVGSRVRAYYTQEGKRSPVVWDARVLELHGDTALLEFGRGELAFTENVSVDWIEADVDLIEALRDIGIMDDEQHFWTLLLPMQEQQVVKSLAEAQMKALFGVRRQATANHQQAIQELIYHCSEIEISEQELWGMLTWIRDLAPIIIHIDIDQLGPDLEQDTHYRNQFETDRSGGLLDGATRRDWEQKLFGGSYDDVDDFLRPKYGVLDVMNDHRGVVCARQYGDSYLLLKNVRLRCSFSPEDSGGICSDHLAVLDQYAHVLLEFADAELREVSRVANANGGSEERIGDSELLYNCSYKEVQIHGALDLKTNVSRLVVHPRHRVDGWNEARICKLCDLHGWEFMWMDDERTRRMNETNTAQDAKMLEMSWQSKSLINKNSSENPNEHSNLRQLTDLSRLPETLRALAPKVMPSKSNSLTSK